MTMIKTTGKVNNIIINDVSSARGDAHGLQLFPGNELKVGDVTISNIYGGASIDSDSFIEPYLPNKLPRSCAFDMWAFFGEEGALDENSITFMDNTKIKINCATRHSNSCSFDFDYVATVLDDGEDANVYVDTSGNRYDFEYGTEIGVCVIIDETLSDFSSGNVIELLSESSDYHKESLQYLVHQNTNRMKSSVDISGINIEMYIDIDNNNVDKKENCNDNDEQNEAEENDSEIEQEAIAEDNLNENQDEGDNESEAQEVKGEAHTQVNADAQEKVDTPKEEREKWQW